ncbi:50S ribosomal protein L22 [bacterium]|nr:MAG: 50S ribosomal protein L22 [bacterium]
MEVRAIAKYVKVQPRKVRIIADEVRGKDANYVSSLLRYHRSKSAFHLRKVLISAMANAQANHNLDPETLRVAAITVDEGPRQKRMQARAMGRGNRILKKTSHITVVVEDVDKAAEVKAHGTKAKPRPSFSRPRRSAPVAAAPASTANVVEEEVTETPTETPVEETVEEATPVTEASAPEQDGASEASADVEAK